MAILSSHFRKAQPASAFAFPAERKEPLTDASHTRNAAARLNQVQGVSAPEVDEASKRIAAADRAFGVKPGPTFAGPMSGKQTASFPIPGLPRNTHIRG